MTLKRAVEFFFASDLVCERVVEKAQALFGAVEKACITLDRLRVEERRFRRRQRAD